MANPNELLEKEEEETTRNSRLKEVSRMGHLKLIVGAILAVMIVVIITLNLTFRLVLGSAQLGRYAETRLTEVFYWLNFLLGIETLVFVLLAGIISFVVARRIASPFSGIKKLAKRLSGRFPTD